MRAAEIMAQPVVVVEETATLEDVARLMLDRHIGSIPVVDREGKLQGIITETDFLAEERYVPFSVVRLPHLFGQWLPKEGIEEVYQRARTLTAREIMSSPVCTVTEDASVEEVVDLMLRHDVYHVPVVRDGRPVGMVARHDLLRMMARQSQPQAT